MASRTKTHFTFTFFSENESCQNSRRMTKEIYIISNSFFRCLFFGFVYFISRYVLKLTYVLSPETPPPTSSRLLPPSPQSKQSVNKPASSILPGYTAGNTQSRTDMISVSTLELLARHIFLENCELHLFKSFMPRAINNRGHCHC